MNLLEEYTANLEEQLNEANAKAQEQGCSVHSIQVDGEGSGSDYDDDGDTYSYGLEISDLDSSTIQDLRRELVSAWSEMEVLNAHVSYLEQKLDDRHEMFELITKLKLDQENRSDLARQSGQGSTAC